MEVPVPKIRITHKKVPLTFRVNPSFLEERTFVPDGIEIVSTGRNPLEFLKLKFLGESGLEMWFRGFPFTFAKKQAEALIKKGFAEVYQEKRLPLFLS